MAAGEGGTTVLAELHEERISKRENVVTKNNAELLLTFLRMIIRNDEFCVVIGNNDFGMEFPSLLL